MTARAAVLTASVALICALAILTVRVTLREGLDVLVLLSLLVLGVLAVGVLGALRAPRRDE